MPTNILGVGKNTSFLADDRIFLGEGLFETIRVEQQCPLYSKLHWQRMRQASVLLGIPFDLCSEMWYEQLIHCIHDTQIISGGIKVLLGGGRAPRGLDAKGDIASLVFEGFTSAHEHKPLRLISAPWLRDAKNPVYQLKSVNYLESILARRQALASGADDALFFNQEHHATETTIANLFIVKKDQIFTPRLADGVLAGITRGKVVQLCKNSELSCTEASVDRKTIIEADAVFVTNALQGIRVVKSFEGSPLPIDHSLIDLLRHLLATDEARWDFQN